MAEGAHGRYPRLLSGVMRAAVLVLDDFLITPAGVGGHPRLRGRDSNPGNLCFELTHVGRRGCPRPSRNVVLFAASDRLQLELASQRAAVSRRSSSSKAGTKQQLQLT